VASSDDQSFAAHLGSTLTRERTRSRYTQEQVADALGVNVETISRFERDAVLPSLTRLVALADVYDVPVSRLLRQGSLRAHDLAEELADALARLGEPDRIWVAQWLTELCERSSQPGTRPHRPQRRPR
jgi:transcriptional regulator with XRE-family HTH domain